MTAPSLSRRRLVQAAGALGAAGVTGLPALARAQAYPGKPIKIVCGFVPGGLVDGVPRLLAAPLGERLGQQVIIETKSGAAGNIATAFVAAAPADGYTLLASVTGQLTVSPHTTTMAINPLTDLVHISMMGEGDQVININADVPARNIAEFIALAKKQPGTLFYGSAGAGGNMHLYIEYFKSLAGIDIRPVHYRGTAQLMPDFIANRVQLSLNAPPVIAPYVAQGKLRPILIVGKQREPLWPDVPTAAEAGLKPLEQASNWFGLHAPKGTPDGIVQKIHKALAAILVASVP
ncbi:MAG: tripartite tricarboxylate transporter substrate binding protein, partial [Haliea sp.]